MVRIIVNLGIRAQVICHFICQFCHCSSSGGPQVFTHIFIIGKYGGCSTNLCTHVANGPLAGTRQMIGTRTKILHDRSGSAFCRQDAGYLQDDILGRSPSIQLACEFDADQFWKLQFPGHSRHDIHRIGAAHTDGHHTQPAGIHCMAVCTNHHTAGESIIFQNHLVDNPRTRFPESEAVFIGDRFQKIIDFTIHILSLEQICIGVLPGLDQVIAMDGGRHSSLCFSSHHELQQGHLCSRILHSHTVGGKFHVRHSPFKSFTGWSLIQMRI